MLAFEHPMDQQRGAARWPCPIRFFLAIMLAVVLSSQAGLPWPVPAVVQALGIASDD